MAQQWGHSQGGGYYGNDIEMGNQGGNGGNDGDAPLLGPLPFRAFLERVEDARNRIRSLDNDIQELGRLHQQVINTASGGSSGGNRGVEEFGRTIRDQTARVRADLVALKHDAERTPPASSGANSEFARKKAQVESLTADLRGVVQQHATVEEQYRAKCREQISRQYRIANPGASEHEVAQAANMDWGDQNVFQSALMSNRNANAQSVLANVRAEHNELVQIEKTLAELAELFHALDGMIVQQEEVVVHVEQQTDQVEVDLKAANVEVRKANYLALHRRKLKWICLGIVVAIILILALALGIFFGTRPNNGK